jgi:polyhydroxyalkanoate synthase
MRPGENERGDGGKAGFFETLRGLFDAEGPDSPRRPDSDSSAVAKTLLFLIDETTERLERLRSRITEEAADEADSAAVEDEEDPVLGGKSFLATVKLLVGHVLHMPESAASHYARFAGEALRIFDGESPAGAVSGDFRFKDRLWGENEFYRVLLQLYLALGRSLQDWLEEQPLRPRDRRRIAFVFEQLVAALAPSNLPINPAALRRAEATDGASVVDGLRQLADDVLHNRAMPRQISAEAYEVGRQLAVTPGAVVHRNALCELIQYAPRSEQVRRRPVLLIPPQINKFYCFDLRPQNSVLGHLAAAGLQPFALSWRNPGPNEAGWTLDSYVAAALEAMDAVAAIARSRRLGLISACAGGLTAMAAMGYLAARGDRRVAHHSLLVTCLFPNQGSKLELFATRGLLESARRHSRIHGVMEGDGLAKLFAWMRPTDLVWRYWINNYLLGKRPPALDILYWDNDSTRLPAGLHADFCDMFEHDVFRTPAALRVLGEEIDFRKLRADHYFVGGEDDYLMPWQGCYETCRTLKGRHSFVLSNSGHVQSILRPTRLAGSHYFTNPDTDGPPDLWRERAARHEGSWWPHWWAWLNDRGGALKRAPGRLGSREFPPLGPAPGDYVLAN